MAKKIGITALIILTIVMFIPPIRTFITNVFYKDKGVFAGAQRKTKPIADSQSITNLKMRAKPDEKNQKSEIQDDIMNYRLKSKYRTRQAQFALKKAGFYTGNIDGKSGPKTKKAIKAFQKSKGLTPDGVIGVRTWEELSKLLKN